MADHTSPFEAGQKLECRIERWGFGGQGIAKPGGFTVLVPKTVPGEKVEVRITRLKKRHAEAELLRVLEPSKVRIQSPCAYFDACGGCQYLHIGYEQGLQVKSAQIVETLERIAKIKEPTYTLKPFIVSTPFGYRNRITLHHDSRTQSLGYVGSNRRILDIDRCKIASERLDALARELRGCLLSLTILTPFVSLRETTGGQLSVTLSVDEQRWNSDAERELTRAMSPILNSGAHLYVAPIDPGLPRVLGKKLIRVHGPALLRETLEGVIYEQEPGDFFQINPEVASKMLGVSREFAQGCDAKSILDVYCGSGFFSLYLSRHGYATYGLEMSRSAILSAQRSAKLQNLETLASFRSGKASTLVERLFREKLKFDACIVDPPRKGLEGRVIEGLAPVGVKHLLYVSCSPPTFARDAALLNSRGYVLSDIQPLDMFPQTYHVELMATFSLRATKP